jgi:hypothetical protein
MRPCADARALSRGATRTNLSKIFLIEQKLDWQANARALNFLSGPMRADKNKKTDARMQRSTARMSLHRDFLTSSRICLGKASTI